MNHPDCRLCSITLLLWRAFELAVVWIEGVLMPARADRLVVASRRWVDVVRARAWTVLAGVVALALVGLGAVAAVRSTELQGGVLAALGASQAVEDDCPAEMPTLREAMDVALRCGTDVEAIDERSPWQSLFATSDGQVRLDTSSDATQSDVDGDGEWASIETTVSTDGSGRLVPMAPAVAMSFTKDGGADEPLATMATSGGDTIEVDVPFDLPQPVVTGGQITYPGVLGDEGIDLIVQVSPDGSGWQHILRIEDQDAAQNPGLQELGDSLGLEIGAPAGLDVAQESGGFTVADAQGQEVMRSSHPLVWTSTPIEASSRSGGARSSTVIGEEFVEHPGPEQIVEVEAEDHIPAVAEIVEEVATEEATVFPIFAATAVSGSLSEVTAVRSAWPTSSSSYQFNGDAGVGRCVASDPYGYECGTTSNHRVLYEFGGLSKIAGLTSADVTKAVFNVFGTHSYNCTKQAVAVYQVGSNVVNSSTSWNSKGSWSTRLALSRVTHRAGCDEKVNWVGFSVLGSAKKVASSNWSALTLGIKADESSMLGWKRYVGRNWEGDTGARATLSITYNQKPTVLASSLQTVQGSQKLGCSTGSSRPTLNTVTPKVSAVLKDPDGNPVKARFQVWQVSNNTQKWGAYSGQLASGRTHTLQVPSGKLSGSNVVYRWRVLARDSQGVEGAWSKWCEFTVDTVKPNKPTITPVTSGTGVEAVYLNDAAEHGGIGMTGKFSIGRNGSSDTNRFRYGWQGVAQGSTVTVGTASSKTISFTPKEPLRYTLSVQAIDSAGNVSDRADYTFEVAAPLATAVYRLDEGSGTTAADGVGGPGSQPLTFVGSSGGLPTWGDGPHELFGSRDGDHAVVFDGVDDRIYTENGIVDTSKSFVVSAHVRLDSDADLAAQHVALSQNGSQVSPFTLGYRVSCASVGGKPCWAFYMYQSDVASPSGVVAQSPFEAVRGQWVHLTGAFDAKTKKATLWACELGTPQSPKPAEPIKSVSSATVTTPWASDRPFVVGRRYYAGAQDNFWDGRIDNVRVFDNQVVAENKIRRLCQGADDYDFVGGQAALDPTLTDTAVDQ
jgi:hypothetical protein